MTKEEKAVLRACNERFDAFIKEGGYSSDAHVIKSQKGGYAPAVKLIRAVARWRKSTGKARTL